MDDEITELLESLGPKKTIALISPILFRIYQQHPENNFLIASDELDAFIVISDLEGLRNLPGAIKKIDEINAAQANETRH